MNLIETEVLPSLYVKDGRLSISPSNAFRKKQLIAKEQERLIQRFGRKEEQREVSEPDIGADTTKTDPEEESTDIQHEQLSPGPGSVDFDERELIGKDVDEDADDLLQTGYALEVGDTDNRFTENMKTYQRYLEIAVLVPLVFIFLFGVLVTVFLHFCRSPSKNSKVADE